MDAAPTLDSPVLPTPEAPPSPVPGMFDLILRGEMRLHRLLRDEAGLPEVIQKFLALSVLGLTIHGVVLGLAAELFAPSHALGWYQTGHPVVWMPLAFIAAFLGALCICLPSFYFYTQLSGLDASFRLVTAQALRAQATMSVLLLGVLPFYTAWLLGTVVGVFDAPGTALFAGMCLPFAVGLLGIRAVYRGFCDLAEHLPITHQRRGNFLRRLVLCWGAVYTVIAPVALYRLGEALGPRL
ncbi:hypothetical protein [Hyalangium rubrum]|uniref:Yip1 domain-containing protein n=1 Tax=Hyalangium rubrum TaxID=3103134 RepID=A0ABU5HC69_9BACT|nr:hypothetical protein [Hyalangium sp. s54d21]MDY7229690.1 hypothetical protein [Hyalangium sp. s54d21]